MIRLWGDAQCGEGMGIEVGRLEGPARGDMRESDEGVHEGELTRVIELQTREALAGGQHGRFGEPPKLPAVDEGLQDVLLDVEVVVDDAGKPLA